MTQNNTVKKIDKNSANKPDSPAVSDTAPELPPEAEIKVKPELPPVMASWLVTKLDCPIQLESHSERNKFAECLNKLIEIANWKEEG